MPRNTFTSLSPSTRPATRLSPSTRPVVAAMLAALPLASCICGDTDVIKVAPQIFVDVCASPQKVVNGKTIGGFADCALPFGEADLSVRAERFFVITNPSNLELKLESIELTGDPAFEFIEEPPAFIGSGLSAQVGVKIRPQLESTVSAEVKIISDANNTPQNGDGKSEVIIPITLTGVDNGTPDIEIIPQDCGSASPLGVDFGRVATDGVTICNVEVRNNGTRELFFDSVDFVPFSDREVIDEPDGSNPEPAFAITGIIPGPDTPLRPTSAENPALTLRLTFAPDVLGGYHGLIRFETSDPDESIIDVPVSGDGVIGPSCVAKVKSVNAVDATGAVNVEPLDDVVLTLEDSTPSTPNGAIVAHRWTLQERGPDSTVVLSSPNTSETGFLFANRRGVDVAGRYEACGFVTDELGTESNNRCCVAFEAIPSQSFLVQLTWAQATGDMDLHVTKKTGANYCVSSLGGGNGGTDAPFSEESCADNTDCGYYNCRTTSTDSPDWDGVAGRTGGDPSLDIDDLTGFGPENINVDLAVAGSYGFGATTFSSGEPFTMTMRLFIFGRLAGEWQDVLTEDFWEVGLVHFTPENPSRPCIEDLTDGNASDECPGL